MPILSLDTRTRIAENAERAKKSLTSLVVAGATVAGGWWMAQTDAHQQELIARFPLLVPYAPYIVAATWLVARLWPQQIVLAKEKAAAAAAKISGLEAEVERLRNAIDADRRLAQPVAAPVPPAPATDDFADTQQVDIPLEPTPPLPPAVLAAAQLVAKSRGLRDAVRFLAPNLTDDQIRAELAKPPAAPLGSISISPAA